MKFLKMVPVCALVVLAFGCNSVSSADDWVAPAPEKSGSDVLVPDQVIKVIPGYSDGTAVYAACDENLWFSVGKVSDSKKAATRMTKEGSMWRGKNLVGKRFHPVRLDPGDKPVWAQLEKVYKLDESFIDRSGGSPALLVK